MAKLDNPRHERFAREYVIDGNATQAYIRAGYSATGAAGNAARLIANDSVRTRIAELQGKAAQKLELTQEKILRDIEEIAEEARSEGQFAAALKGKELLGKHTGMWPQKSEVTVRRIGDLNDAQLEQLDRLLEMAAAGDSGDPGRDKSRAH